MKNLYSPSTFLHFMQESNVYAICTKLHGSLFQVLFLTFMLSFLSFQGNATCTTCVDNKITNGGFDTNTSGWTSLNGNFTSDTPYPQCGTPRHALMYRTSGTAQFYQDVTSIPAGSTVKLTFWAGVHDNAYDAQFGMEFYNGSTFISQSKLQVDKILAGTPSMQLYTITVNVPNNATKVRVIGTVTFDWLKVDEVCLNVINPCANFKSLAQSDLNLVKTRTISNEVNCNNGAPDRVLWLDCILDNSAGGTTGNLKYWKIISGGTFKEYCDGTASFDMRVQNVVNANYKFDVSVILTGRAFTAPSGSPHLDGCTGAATSNWYYYTDTKGTMTGVDGLAGAVLSFTRKGPSFQLGTNASLFGTTGTFGASGWLMYEIITQPAAFNLEAGCDADINFFLSGGNLTSAQASVCGEVCSGTAVTLNAIAVGGKPAYSYTWSGGLGSGQTKTVNPSVTTNYTVTVTDALGCTSTDVTTITVKDCCTQFVPVINGTNAICTDNTTPTALTATGGGTYIWNNGETTATINVSPAVTTTYTVTVTSPDGCVKSASKTLNVFPCTGEICFSGNNNVSATANWVITYALDPANNKVKVRATLSKNFVDNTYGTNAIGWPSGHTFSNLVGSDQLQIALLDANNVKKMEFKMDYITASTLAPSGYKSLGVTGGDGQMILGSSADVLNVVTSLDVNFNQYGYILTTNSPSTNASYAPNASYPNWIYDVWYEAEVKLSAFGSAGFGKVGITGVHASPSKTGNNTEIVYEVPCPDPCDSFTPTITGSNAICSDNLVPTTLTATGGGTYLWSTGETTAAIDVTPSTTTTYTVTVTSVDNCVQSSSKTVSVIPCSGQLCFNGANGVGATTNWTITYTQDPVNDKVKIRATLSKNFVDNTYGTNAIGWTNGHTFGNLTGSDHLVLSMLDGNNVKRLETKLDYLTASSGAPSGYDCLGVLGGEGQMILGSSSDVLSVTTSLDQNFNTYGYVLTTNSPATDADYTPNPSYPNWIFDVWYEVEVRLSAFGSAGFGKVGITGVHASPSKTGNNTEEVTEGPCCELTVNITGDNTLCPGESTQLSASYLETNTLYITATTDNSLSQLDAAKNFGACKDLPTGSKSSTDKSRSVLKFDLSSLPAGANITSASLTMTKTGGSNTIADFGVHRVTNSWTEGAGGCSGSSAVSNWNQRQTGTSWATPGGDFAPTAESVMSVGGNAQYSWNIKNLVIGWANGSITNNGVLVKLSTEGSNNEKVFASSENGDATIRPMLSISYLVPPTPGQSTYSWSNGATTASITVTPAASTTYTVTVSESGGCTGIKTIDVSLNPTPTVDAGQDISYCGGQSVILTSNATGGTPPYVYNWNNPPSVGASKTVNPTQTTTYIVTVTDANGCQDTDNITVNIIPGPNVNVGPDINLCTADEEIINSIVTNVPSCGTTGTNDCNHVVQGTTGWIESAPAAGVCGDNAGTKLWTSSGQGTSSITLDFGAIVPTGTVICLRMKLEHCSGTSASISDAKIQRSLNSGSGYTDVIASKTFSSTTYTEYCYTLTTDTRYVKVLDNGKCAFRVDYVKYQTPDTYNNTIEYFWSGPGIVGSVTGPSIIVNQGGTYVLVVTDCGGCTASDAVNVNINGDVNADAGPDQIICSGTSATLTAASVTGATYEWRTSGNSTVISTAQSFMVSPTQNTTYILKVVKNGCEDTDAVEVTVNGNPTLVASAAPPAVCLNGTSVISAAASGGTSPYTYNWSNGLGAGAQKSVSPSVATTYSVTVSDLNGCTASSSVSVTVNPSPSVSVEAAPSVICKNESSILTASASGGLAPYTITWSNGLGSGTQKTVSPAANITYVVTVTDSNGCTATGSVQVTVKSLPDNSGITGPNEVCANEFAVFTASPPIAGATYFWDFNGGITTDGDNDDVSETVSWPVIFKNTFRTVTLTVTKDNCPFTYTKQVYVKQGPFLNTPGAYDVCQGGNVQIGPNPNDPNQVTPGSTFLWTPNLFLNNNTVAQPVSSPPFDITYTLTATVNGCVETKQVLVNVDVNLNPIADAGPDKTTCLGVPVVIGGNPTATPPPGGAIQGVVWIPAAGLNNPLIENPTANPTINTQYKVIVVATSGCADTAVMNLTILPKPQLTLQAAPAEICSGSSTVLTATPSGGTPPYTVSWSNALGAGLSKTVAPIINTSYGVTVTDFNGCTASSVITVIVNPKPSVSVTANPEVICLGSSSTLVATATGGTQPYTYSWSNGLGDGNSKIVSPSASTSYTVTVTDAKGCSASNTVSVTVEIKAKVGDFVWVDVNGNGRQETGEPGLNGITVSLYNANTNALVASTTTVTKEEEDGYYEFEVCKGSYYIIFGTLPTYNRTVANVPADDTKDSDADVNTGQTATFVLNPGDFNQTVDAGYYKLASIGDFVWFDINADGIQDLGESGVSAVTVNLTGNAGDGSPVNLTQSTNGSGLYLFTNLKPGVYTVQVVKPINYLFSTPNVGVDDAKDSDSEIGTGAMSPETLTSGEDNRTYDAGIYPAADLQINKTFISAVQKANGSFDVKYTIDVENLGGFGAYNLTDNQGFDSDIIINSASYISNAPGNPGNGLAGVATWTLATNQPIAAFATHTYTLTVNVNLNLTDNIGNNIYTSCSGQTPTAGQGLYNKASIYVNNVLKDEDDACGDIPNVVMMKNFVGVSANANGSFNVTYTILVNNNGGATGTYSLKDTPLFDNDVTIVSGSFSGQANGPMNTSGSTTLATNATIAAGATQIYTVTFNVTLNLAPGSPDGGDNVYTACAVPGNGPGSNNGQGLYNKAELDRTGDGITDITDDACGDLPNVTMVKNFVGTTANPNGSYNVTYAILVNNNGGATGTYSLKDTPLFDNDVTIVSGSFSGQANGPMNTSGSTTLATNATIAAGATHTYTVTFNVTLNLAPGSPDGGDNVYTACAVPGDGPGSNSGQGLYNKAELDRTGDGITDITDDACGDLPNVTMVKNFVGVTANPNGSYNVTYAILVNNNGGATGTYSLKDTPLFDNDVTIVSGSFSGQANGPMNTSGSTSLATNASIAAGATHTYTVTFNVTLNLAPGSPDGGDNVYTACAVPGDGPGSNSGQGLYNKAELDRTGDGITDITDDACGDLPNVTMVKNFVGVTANPNGSYNVTYAILVNNNGGAVGTYSLKDTPLFDNDVTILSGNYNGHASGSMNTSGSTTLATNAGIAAGATHIYTVTFNVTLNLAPGSPDGGDNVYTACAVPGNGPGSNNGQGLYNKAELDRTGDGITDITDDACGDLPNVTMVKNFVGVTANPNGSYNVTYAILVNNNGGATGTYSLKDTPLFDNDVTIVSGSFSGQANGPMNTSGSTSLATNATIAAGATHIYTVTFNVTLNLAPGSPDGGDNVYTACAVPGNGPGSNNGQGLYNKAELDRTGDGITDITDDACGDLPNVTMVKNFVGVTANPNGSYNVTYAILVNNNGGATGTYSLKDTPLFDNDVTIVSGSFSGQANGPMNTSGSTTLATNATIAAGATHTYTVTFNVTLNLAPGSPDGGDNVYTACAVPGNGPGSNSGQGLYNKAELDRTGDGITDITDDACGDLPNVTMVKNFVGVTANPNGSYNVTYAILVNNNGGAVGTYSLKDTPLFDNDVTILSGNYNGHASGSMNTSGSTTLATNAGIAAGATHIYTVTFNVTLNLAPGSPDGGDNVYTACAVPGNGPGSNNGQGLYNKAELDRTGDGITDITDDACGDLPNVTMVKNFVGVTANPNGSYNVTYAILVNNNGGATGTYSLKDTPLFDNDVTIVSGSFSGQANGPMNTSGSTTLATNATIAAGATHTYTVTFNVTLNLAPGSPDGGDNVYTACAVPGNGPGSNSGQGLYNKAELDRTGDGITDITDDACGDLPYIKMVKDFVSVTPLTNGTYNVKYQITVNNVGGANGQYTLKDYPLFDDDVTIEAWDYTFVDVNGGFGNGPSFIGAPAIPINFGTKTLEASNTHIYTISFTVRLNLAPGSPDGGNNIYTPCAVPGNGPGSNNGQGLYNRAEVDWTGDGITDITDDACGDLPNITMVKNFVNVVPQANGSYNVNYTILVNNNGGATGKYSLKDTPLFDNDVTIISGNYNGQANGSMNISGATTLATNVNISAGTTHIYNITFNVTLNLSPGSPDGGDNIYTPCAVPGNGPGSNNGQGLYNKAELDWTGDNITDITDDACGDLPYVTMIKNFVSVSPNANGSFNVNYAILVNNNGGSTGTYSLKDTPLFDNDVTILSGSFNGQANGSMNTSGSTTLATNTSIAAGATHIYNVTFVVRLNIAPGSPDGGDNIYTPCAVPGNGPGSNNGQGLYNKAELDRTGDGITDITDDACGDLPNITMHKDFVNVLPNAVPAGSYKVTYNIIVSNNGGATGNYSLQDTPLFDDDVTIHSGTYTGQANGNMNTSGSTTLANNVSIANGATHIYTVMFVVSLNVEPGSQDGGDNIYSECQLSQNGDSGLPFKGLYNRALLDWTGDNIPDIIDDACGDLPGSLGDFVWDDKNANGVQDPGEPGIPNVLVRLFNQGGTQISSAVTSPTGYYLFKDLPEGTYSVGFTKPFGYQATVKDADVREMIVSTAGGQISKVLFNDKNNNGIFEAGDSPKVNTLVELRNVATNALITTAFTDNTGLFTFNGLVPNSMYKVVVSDDARDSDADPVTGLTAQVFLNSGEQNLTIDAGFYKLAKIGDFVWEDKNVNGIQDPFEAGIPNVVVNLTGTDAKGVAVNLSTSTSPTGLYEFKDLVPGSYTVTFIRPGAIYLSTPSNSGLDDAKDSDADIYTGVTSPVVLNSGDINNTIDAGYYRCAKVGDYVWLDLGTMDNLQDAGDVGLNGIVVELYSVANPSVPYESQLTRNNPVTGKEGYYLFECMPPGDYFIKVRKPEQYIFVTPNQGLDDTKDSDIVDFLNERTLNFSVAYAQIIEDIDIGFDFKVLPVSLTRFEGWWNKTDDVNELVWETASELNSDYFEVERSFKGSTFTSIGNVLAAGNSTQVSLYNWIDKDIKENGLYSYRLRQVDFDGKVTYSGIIDILVDRKAKSEVFMYPNPAVNFVNIDLEVYAGAKVFASIFDNSGKLVKNAIINEVIEVQNQTFNIDVLDMNPGVYTVMINIDGLITSHKLIVLK